MTFDAKETLETSLAAREDEVDLYEFNIENFRRGIVLASERGLTEFAKHLDQLLGDHERERDKAQVMLDVLRARVTEMEAEE